MSVFVSKRHLDDVRMSRAENYETVSKFAKVMPRILDLALFSRHGVLLYP